jgi:putative cardiolipin synthase
LKEKLKAGGYLQKILRQGQFAITKVVIGWLMLLSACATVPPEIQKAAGNVWAEPESTALGQFFAQGAPNDGVLSGVFLLDDPRVALRSRLVFASLAEKTLDLQYYLWKGDTTGGLLLHRALEAADRGVKVRILIDDIYHNGRDAEYAAIDAHPNIEVRVFNPIGNRKAGRRLNFVINKRKLNNRMHNKIFLADGAVSILGGRNIGDDYFGIDPKLNFRDLDVLAVGPAAREAGAAYDLYWNSQGAVPIGVLRKTPAEQADLDELRGKLERRLEEQGAVPYTVPVTFEEVQMQLARLRRGLIWAKAQVIVDPLERFEGTGESAFVALGRELTEMAERDLVLQSAYLIPTRESIGNMARLTARGVRVRALTNSLMSNNHISVHAHYMKYRKLMLEAGVELYELRADAALREFLKRDKESVDNTHAGLHTKAAVIDAHTTMIGSFNMDPRSRDLNSEIGLLIRSEAFAATVLRAMERDFDPTNSYRVDLTEQGNLRWTGASAAGPVEFRKEPNSTFWKRMAAALIRIVPVEGEL